MHSKNNFRFGAVVATSLIGDIEVIKVTDSKPEPEADPRARGAVMLAS